MQEKGKAAAFYYNYAVFLEETEKDDKKSLRLKEKAVSLQKTVMDHDFVSNAVNFVSFCSDYACDLTETGKEEEAEYWLTETLKAAEKLQKTRNQNLDQVLAASYLNAGTAYERLKNDTGKYRCHQKVREICQRHSEEIFRRFREEAGL